MVDHLLARETTAWVEVNRGVGSITSPNGNDLCIVWTTTRSSCCRWRWHDTGKSHDNDGASEPVEKTTAEDHTRGQCTHGQRKAICLKHFDFDHGVPWNGVVTEIIHCWTRSLGSGSRAGSSNSPPIGTLDDQCTPNVGINCIRRQPDER
jgi:hypothetical protein